jgi:hypothetical protein
MVPWIISLLIALVPNPPKETDYTAVARAIDAAAHEFPLPGEDGVVEMATELSVLAWAEGGMRVDAVAQDYAGFSWGLWQIHESNFKRLGISRLDAMNPMVAAKAAAKLILESHRICRKEPVANQLAEYAAGLGRCDIPEGVQASQVRMGRAQRLLKEHPPRWSNLNE